MSSKLAVLFSGGLDSSILLAREVQQGAQVWPLYIDCQLQWQPAELAHARRFLQAVAAPNLQPLVVLSLPVGDLYGRHWSTSGQDVPSSTQPDEDVYLPGRNPLLLVKSYIWCHLNQVPRLALGSLATNPFADATPEFFATFGRAMEAALSGHVDLARPLADFEKRAVMQLGREYPLELTFTCLRPVDGQHCGRCNKCAERQHAFRDAGLPDLTSYRLQPSA